MGCNEHITKPFDETELFEAIARYLGVRYRYCNRSQEISRSGQKNLTFQDLTIMPDTWLTEVYEAALDFTG